MTDYTLTRSNRKTIAIYVRDGSVEVRAPLQAPKRDIDLYVASKEAWILEKLAASNERLARRESFSLDYGDSVIYRGRPYPIVAKDGRRVGFDGEAFYMPPGLPPEDVKAACVQVYRLLAKRDLTNRALDFAKQMGVTPSAVKINGAAGRWGSCSAQKSLNFSWRLVMAEDALIDYVVVHELAHITEMNHSPRFWAIVEGVLPDFQVRRKKLKELQRRLSGEDWE
ncbi:MAG: M48 family metallopeptidase [Oscillospiraceae bacterium]|nr:M48 family metallopeptidase [Oscillospiraceae bacterium]